MRNRNILRVKHRDCFQVIAPTCDAAPAPTSDVVSDWYDALKAEVGRDLTCFVNIQKSRSVFDKNVFFSGGCDPNFISW